MSDVRESMRRLPAPLQPALTWITGKPLYGQQPLVRSSSLTQTLSALLSLFGGAAWGFWVLARVPAPWSLAALVPGWLFVAGAARKIQVTLVHQCSHFNFTGSKRWDRLAAQALSTLVLTDHFDSYFREHILIHHTRSLASAVDPDCRFLLELGFRPGMSEQALWRRLARTALSPRFHWIFLRARLRSNFVAAPRARRFAAVAYHSAWLAAVAATGAWAGYLLAWWLPLVAVYQVAALLNFSSLHVWLKEEVPGEGGKARLCSLTHARFLGDAAPAAGTRGHVAARAWARWALRLAFVHLPARIAVLSGDLPVHDYHHRHPRCAEWADFIYRRQRDLERGSPGWPAPYTENWGLGSAIGAVFRNLSALPGMVPDEEQAPGDLDAQLVQL